MCNIIFDPKNNIFCLKKLFVCLVNFPLFLSKITVELDIERASVQSKILEAEPNFQLGRESQPKPGADADFRSSLHMQPVTDDSDPLSSSTSQVNPPSGFQPKFCLMTRKTHWFKS